MSFIGKEETNNMTDIKKLRSELGKLGAKLKWAKYDTPEKRKQATEKMRIGRHKKKKVIKKNEETETTEKVIHSA